MICRLDQLHVWTALILVLIPIEVRSEMVTLTTELDTTLYENDGSRSNGAGGVFYAGTNATPSPRRGLLQFDIAGSLPLGAAIQSAQLTLYVAGFGGGSVGGSDPTAYLTSLHSLTRNWGEGTTGAGSSTSGSGQGFVTPTDGTSATWTHAFYNTQSWTPGGDFELAPVSSALVSGNIDSAFTWGSTSSMIAQVQSWLDTPTNNFGWILRGDETASQSFRSFYSHETIDVALRPSLTITYSPLPEPSSLTMSLLSAFGWPLIRCNRWSDLERRGPARRRRDVES